MSGQIHELGALHPGKEPRYPLIGRLGCPQNLSGGFGKEKNFVPLSGFGTPYSPTRSLDRTRIALCHLPLIRLS